MKGYIIDESFCVGNTDDSVKFARFNESRLMELEDEQRSQYLFGSAPRWARKIEADIRWYQRLM
jgi:hypothetical protein